jgi:hypothetical protein
MRTGWVLLALLPVTLIGAMVLGDWLLSVQGHSAGEAAIPAMVALRAGLPAVTLLVSPLVAAAWCGRAAARAGDPRGRSLFVVGGILALAMVALNLIQVLARALGL